MPEPDESLVLRVVCDAPTHPEVVVATFHSLPLTSEQERQLAHGISPVRHWSWVRHLAVGGGPLDDTGLERSWTHQRPLREHEQEHLRGPEVEIGPKRLVRGLTDTYDRLVCPRCARSLSINRGDFEARMDACLDAGVSRISLLALIAIMTRR